MGNNKYTDEFRRETADYVISTGRQITEVAREFRFNDKTVNDWVLKRKRSQGSTPNPKAEDCKVHRDRLHRVLLQLQEPPLNNRLQGAGRRDGRVLRALRERVVGVEGGVASGINPRVFVSEILT